MSELKSKLLGQTMNEYGCDTKIYLKSEADKVITEKDEKIGELEERIDELQKAADSAWSKVNAMYDELRHHKYKRCLAMEKWCHAEYDIYNLTPRTEKVEFYRRWRKRWLKLAEKFKEETNGTRTESI